MPLAETIGAAHESRWPPGRRDFIEAAQREPGGTAFLMVSTVRDSVTLVTRIDFAHATADTLAADLTGRRADVVTGLAFGPFPAEQPTKGPAVVDVRHHSNGKLSILLIGRETAGGDLSRVARVVLTFAECAALSEALRAS